MDKRNVLFTGAPPKNKDANFKKKEKERERVSLKHIRSARSSLIHYDLVIPPTMNTDC